MSAPGKHAKEFSPTKILLLTVIWGAGTVVMNLMTGSPWWLSAIGGAGIVALVLSFTLPPD